MLARLSLILITLLSLALPALAQITERAYPFGRPEPEQPLVTTSGNSCRCEVASNSGNACVIYLRTNAADWIVKNAPQTAMRSSNDGRYYEAPFALAASACAGRKVNPGQLKVHWLNRRSAILEWK